MTQTEMHYLRKRFLSCTDQFLGTIKANNIHLVRTTDGFFSSPTHKRFSVKRNNKDSQENCLTVELTGAAVVMPHPVE